MPFTDGYQFPSDSELNVEEVNISTPALRAGAYYFGKHCEEPSKEFMLCRTEERDPRKCLAEGREVTKCALDFFRKTKKACRQQFDDYAHCLEWSSSDMEYRHCRKTQAALDGCMLDKLGIERPHLGYFAMPRIHHTERPRPTEKGYRDDYPQTPKLEDDFPRRPARHGLRTMV